MKYHIKIVKSQPNENYKEELKACKQSNRGYGMSMEEASQLPKEYADLRVLEVVLTEEEYRAVKSAVIKVFE